MKEQAIDEILKEIDRCFLLCKSKTDFKNELLPTLQRLFFEHEQKEKTKFTTPEDDEL